MKLKKRIPGWIALSLILQLAVLFYIDYYFLGGSGNVIAETWGAYDFRSFKLQTGVSNIKVSNDALYVSYELDGKLNFIDMKTRKNMYELKVDGYTLSFYKWLPDRNRVIAVFGMSETNFTNFKVYAYDCGKSEMEIQNITKMPASCRVEDVQFSTLTNLIYISMRYKDGPVLYRIGIMGDKMRVYPSVKGFSNLKQCNLKDTVVYEDPITKKVYIQEGSEAWTVTLKTGAYLLGIDEHDNVYIAEEDGGKCSIVRYGKLNTKVASWHNINLGGSINPNNIIIQRDGKVFVKEESQNYLRNVLTGAKTTYEGQFLELHDNFVASLHKNRIKVIPTN